MVNGKSFGSPAAVGLGQEHMLALQSKITQKFSGEDSETAQSEGSGDKVAEQSFKTPNLKMGKYHHRDEDGAPPPEGGRQREDPR